MVHLAVCAIIRDEAPSLREWVAFHRLQGVERFTLYDNFSVDEPRDVLADEIADGLVEIRRWEQPIAEGGQVAAYRHALDEARDRDRWVAFLDVDEFLRAPAGGALLDVLGDHEGVAGVAVRWQVYGSSGHHRRPPGLVIEEFAHRAPTRGVRNRRTKCVVDPRHVEGPAGPHYFVPRASRAIVDERGRPVTTRTVAPLVRRGRRALVNTWSRVPADPYAVRDIMPAEVSVELLRIDHFAVKSREEYDAKRRRFASPTTGARSLERRYGERYFRYHDRNDVHDPVPVDIAAAVRAAVG